MHGSIADTNYYMHESFDHTAAFLTPIALITSADALGHAHKLTDDGSAERERVEVAKLAVCESSSFASLTFRCAPISCPGQVVLMQKTALLLSDNVCACADYPILLRWEEVHGFATKESLAWPIESTKDDALQWFMSFGKKIGLTHLNEGGSHNLSWFEQNVKKG